MKWRQTLGNSDLEVDVFVQGTGIFLLGMDQQAGNLIRWQVVIDMAIIGEFLKSGKDSLMILLDFVAFTGQPQNLLGQCTVIIRSGFGGQLVIDLIAVMCYGFSTLQRAVQLEYFFIQAGDQQ